MTTVILLAVLGALLGAVLMQLFKKPSPPPAPGPDLSSLKVTEARAGDVISITGVGDNLADLDFTADRRIGCEAGSFRWLELSGSYRDRSEEHTSELQSR